MSATMSHPPIAMATTARPLRFGAESGAGEHVVQGLPKRKCSATPRRMMGFCASPWLPAPMQAADPESQDKSEN